ncbi:sensor histidine kinase [Vibrio algivorus]|uniref:histidine kinase n=1 Tax=Vibrio algivorus TaxID=1667024 RepID=A0A557NX04_9VIBR|nr:HAMP domain-containing sensor histidine kinase [Vibrio algivorus]TVO32887.1 HAMP domain-containing histidine kinase [Vibrio algivorus]
MYKQSQTSSIKRNLVNSISLVFGIIIFAVYLSVDLSLDSWVDKQFDKSLINKANYMKSLVKVSGDRLSFDDEHLSEFQEDEDVHFYQLWSSSGSFKRSKSLVQYPQIDLLQLSLPLNTNQLLDVTLPNGEEGRAFISYFLPESEQLSATHEHPAYLALYQSSRSSESMLVLIDILLIVTFFISIVVMRYIAIRIVDKGLKPLQTMNAQIKKIGIDQSSVTELPEPDLQFDEIEPIRKELNAFIKANQVFLQNEKRLTGDIAHELKTPIAEIMSLSEIYIRYPEDERIGATYKQDMLKIAQRMKKIVDNLLLLQKTSSATIQIELEAIDLYQLISEVIAELTFKYSDADSRIQILIDKPLIFGDSFSLHTILQNLIDNALFYSPEGSQITISLVTKQSNLVLEVRNQVCTVLTEQDIAQLLEPMYQADQSRTSNDRYGLGLSIVNNLCRLNDYQLDVVYQEREIGFRIQGIEHHSAEIRKEI